jgi:citrate lyase subunit beta/citryl-CoA lyase
MNEMVRSMLFVPGDSERKFQKAAQGEADALIIDLEDSVAPAQKAAARAATAAMLAGPRGRQLWFVRVNALDTNQTLADLAAVMPGRPDGIVLPKCSGGHDVRQLSHYLDAFEAAHALPGGGTRILAIATETAGALFGLGSYAGVSPRLWGLMWGAEDLAAALGAFANRDATGHYGGPFTMARNLCLAGARAAGVLPIDTVYVDIKNLGGLRDETLQARRDGFAAKAVIHPAHVDVVNAAFAPSADEIAWARRIVAALADGQTTGVVSIDGQMIDKPHLRKAEAILALARVRAQPAPPHPVD